MLYEQFGLSWRDLEYELYWWSYYTLLSVALDLSERDRYWQYMLAGGDPKKWRWSSPDRAGTEPDRAQRFWNKVKAKLGGGTVGNIGDIAQEGWKRVERVEETWSDGSTRIKYLSESGEDITDQVEAEMKAGRIFMKERAELD